MSTESYESVELVKAGAEIVFKAQVAMPGAGVTSVEVGSGGIPLVAFLDKAGIDLNKSANNGVSFINQEGRTLSGESLVRPNDTVTAATNRDNG